MILAVDIERTPMAGGRRLRRRHLARSDRVRHPDAVRQAAWAFRLTEDGDVRILWGLRADGWLDLYTFSEEPQLPVDYEVANHYTSTWPRSPFVTKASRNDRGSTNGGC